MPSRLHEAIVQMVMSQPESGFPLLRQLKVPALEDDDVIEADSADLGTAVPAELAADCVLKVLRAGKIVLVIIVEVQLAVDPDKLFSWPAYIAGARLRHRCEVMLLVITPRQHVAGWASRAISLGPGAGFLQALVVGPGQVPPIVDSDKAKAAPELAVLSAITHGQDPDPAQAVAVATAAAQAAMALGDRRSRIYYDLIRASLSDLARKAFEMIPQNHEYLNEDMRLAVAEGKAEGALAATVASVLGVLQARGLSVSVEQRKQIEECSDLETLKGWLVAAVTAKTVAAMLNH